MTRTATAGDADQVVRKVTRRLLPLLVLLYVVNFVDRANISVAALAMNTDLGLSAFVYGLAAGVFFLGYVLFQVPSNAILRRLGARTWITVLIVGWGLCSAATALVTGAPSLYLARFLLGVAEAGFFPGIICYLTAWFPCRRRAKAVALFLLAIPVANVVGLPLSGLIVEHGHMLGLSGWRLMFLIEGMPAVLLGMVAYRLLPDGPTQAPWLSVTERQSLHQAIHADVAPAAADAPGHRQPIVALAGIYAGLYFGLYALQFFLPQMIAGLHLGGDAAATSVFAAVPYALAALFMVGWSRRCDRNGNRRRYIAVPAFAAAAATTVAVGVTGPALAFAALCVATAGIFAAVPAFWSLCIARLTGPGAPIAIAVVNSVASLASFLGPSTTGWLVDHTGGFRAAMTVIACCLTAVCAGALLLTKALA